jgi:3-phenylpropionate/cinnamic acid dioxygenase small subunit
MKAKHKLAIHELMSRAAYYFDAHDADGLEACFCEDARMLVDITGGETFGPFEGRDSIMELMRGSLEAQKDRRRHIICDLFFESEGKNEATVVSTLVVSSVDNDEMTLVTSGVYRDQVRKVGSDWLIADRHVDLDRMF